MNWKKFITGIFKNESRNRKVAQRVFISYSSVDEGHAHGIASILDSIGVSYFLDKKDITWGQSVSKEIEAALVECVEIIVIISPASLKSQWVSFEIGMAKGKGKRVLPFLVHPSMDIPSFLSDLHYKTSLEQIKLYFQSQLFHSFTCTICGYTYDPTLGDPDNGIAPETKFSDIPGDWECPVCGAGKDDFELD